ncbi:MAG: hypothetical protein AAF202_10190 [Pseudomonadota bacterium]
MSWLVFVFGFVSAFRILKSYSKKSYLPKNSLTKIGTLYLVLSFLLIRVSEISLLMYVFLVFTLLCSIAAFPLLMVLLKEKRFEDHICDLLDTVALKMSLGESFRSAFHSSVELQKGTQFSKECLKLYRSVTFPQQNGADFHSVSLYHLVLDLRHIGAIDFGAIEALKSLTHHQKMLSGFRRKSGKARAQVLIQAWILTGVQIALTFFMCSIFGFKSTLPYFICSSVLMLLGHCISHRLGRRIRWRI